MVPPAVIAAGLAGVAPVTYTPSLRKITTPVADTPPVLVSCTVIAMAGTPEIGVVTAATLMVGALGVVALMV